MTPRQLLGCALVVLAAGCGTTVPSQVAGRLDPSFGRTAPQLTGTAGAAALAARQAAAAGAGTTAAPAGGGAGGGGAGGGAAGAAAGSPAVAGTPLGGRSAGPIRVGLMYSSDANAVASSLGTALSEPDYRAIQNAVIDWVNHHGGVAGHRLEGEFYDASQTKSAQQISQEACASWVQDHHVLAAVPGLAVIDTSVLSQCLGKAHVVTAYEGSYSTLDEHTFGRLPYWFEPDTLSLDKLATVYVQALAQLGFVKGARIGLVYDQYPEFASVAQRVLIPAIRAAGGTVAATFQQGIHSTSDIAAGSSQMSSAVLQFRSANVSKVMFFDAWVGGWIEFAIAAQDQSWHPAYGLSSQDGPQDSVSTGLVPTAQLPGTVFAGWYSVDDVLPQDGGTWARRAECLAIFRAAAIDPTTFGTDGYGAAMSMCSGLLVLRDAAPLVPDPLDPAALAGAMAALGGRLQSATVPATSFAGRRYGVAGWRPGRYVDACSCFRYTGSIHPFS